MIYKNSLLWPAQVETSILLKMLELEAPTYKIPFQSMWFLF